MQTTQQQTSAKPDLFEEGLTRGKQYAQNGPHTSYSSYTNQETTMYVGHKWAWAIHEWPPVWPGPCGPSHGQLCSPGNRPRSKEMHISSSLHITSECEGGSGRNKGGVNAPRGYYYTRGYRRGAQLRTEKQIEEDLVHQPLKG